MIQSLNIDTRKSTMHVWTLSIYGHNIYANIPPQTKSGKRDLERILKTPWGNL